MSNATVDASLTVTVPDRFKLVRPLGEGGMGIVFEAFDKARNLRVALKVLKRLASRKQGAQALLRFKREFRALQDLHHKNLVSLGELISEGQQWFFTMELVEGLDLLAYVRPRAHMAAHGLAVVESADDDDVEDAPVQFVRMPTLQDEGPRVALDEARLRAALPQLAEGIAALHAVGKVHRDIKPSNIRVTAAGRVVLLDFGLVAEVSERPSIDGDITGTPAYMAPEQSASQAVGPAADWYALGVVLYEALTGRLPFDGEPLSILMQKQKAMPPAPGTVCPDVPPDLDALCMRLLRTDPAERPGGAEVLRALETGPPVEPTPEIAWQARRAQFVGRSAEIDVLDEALADTRTGSAVVVLVDGESGVGKSCLMRHFCERAVARDPRTVVLAGRCYEREQVPYKGFDGVIDELARYMASIPDEQAFALLPSRIGPLVQVFPVLRRSPAFAFAVTEEARDPHELRRRAFVALREVFARIAAHHPLVLAIDDLQWADSDSLSLLTELFRLPAPPHLLLVATVRDAPTAERSGGSTSLGIAAVQERLPCPVRRVTLGRLSEEDARALASSLLRPDAAGHAADAEAIAREANGHPLFIDELARHAALVQDRATASEEPAGVPLVVRPGFDLEDVLGARIARLDDDAKRVLDFVAIAGRPFAQETIARAAGMDMATFGRAVAQLRAAHLLVTSGARGADRIEPYHERVRSAVIARLAPPRRASCHRRLAMALEAVRWPDGEALSVHWAGAGNLERAAKHAVAAAHQAGEALAFDRAAGCWQRALSLTPAGDPKARLLRIRLADALANAGRGTLAAPLYSEAAEGADAAEALDLRRRAAEQYLRAGRFDEGVAAVRGVLALLGLVYPRSALTALLQLVVLRLFLLLRGVRFEEREASLVPQRELLRVDACWSVAFAMGMSDHIFGAVFQARAVLFALRAGEPNRVARALAITAGYLATSGGRASARVETLLARARALAERTGEPHSIAYTVANSAIAHYLAGRFRHALDDCDRADAMFRDRVPGSAWEQAMMHHFALLNLGCLGQLAELQRRQPQYLQAALDRGDLYGSVCVRIGWGSLVWLSRGDPEGLRRDLGEAMAAWSKKGCHLEHFYELGSRTNADLYDGRATEALARAEEQGVMLRSALLFRIESVRIWTMEIQARCALAVACTDPSRRARLLRQVDKKAKAILRERAPWAKPLATLLRASVAQMRDRRDDAILLLRAAIYGFEAAGMGLYEAAARRRLAGLVAGEESRSLVSQTDKWFKQQQVVDADALTATVAPGYDGPPKGL